MKPYAVAVKFYSVLQFGHEEQTEQTLPRKILDHANIPYIVVDIHSSWRLPWDRHPNAQAARAIAIAIASELRNRGTALGANKQYSGFN